MVVPGRLDPHPHTFGAHPLPCSGDSGHELTGAGDGKVELERRSDDLSIVVSDKSYRGALTDIDRDHQTPLRRQITNSIHIASLSDTTGEARHINLLQGKDQPTFPKEWSQTWDLL